MGKIILVTGGARSGKSTYAENLVRAYGDKVMYIATSIPFDDEMKDRVKKHQHRRPQSWGTFEAYKDLQRVFKNQNEDFDIILLDCVTIMVTNLIFDFVGDDIETFDSNALDNLEQFIMKEITEFLEAIDTHPSHAILVTNEVGYGIVPDNKLSRVFRDIAGRVNQYIASKANEVYLVVCGIPVKVK